MLELSCFFLLSNLSFTFIVIIIIIIVLVIIVIVIVIVIIIIVFWTTYVILRLMIHPWLLARVLINNK